MTKSMAAPLMGPTKRRLSQDIIIKRFMRALPDDMILSQIARLNKPF